MWISYSGRLEKVLRPKFGIKKGQVTVHGFSHCTYSTSENAHIPHTVPAAVDDGLQLFGFKRSRPEDALGDVGQPRHIQPVAPTRCSLRQLIEESDELWLHLLLCTKRKRKERDRYIKSLPREALKKLKGITTRIMEQIMNFLSRRNTSKAVSDQRLTFVVYVVKRWHQDGTMIRKQAPMRCAGQI